MEKIFILFILSFLCLNSIYAQVADTNFGEDKAAVSRKVENRFGAPDGSERNSIYYFDKSYAGHNWSYITFDFKYDIDGGSHLNYVALSKDFKNQASALSFLNKIKASLSYNFIKQSDEQNVSHSYKSKTNGITICLYIYKTTDANPYSVSLSYQEDKISYIPESLYYPIAKTAYGENLNETKRKLSIVLGTPEATYREFLMYYNVNYAEIKWDAIIFHFIYDSKTNHLDSFSFMKSFETVDQAKRFRDTAALKDLSEYTFLNAIDKAGFKKYIYGDSLGNSVFISVAKEKNKYNVYLDYYSGKYNDTTIDNL